MHLFIKHTHTHTHTHSHSHTGNSEMDVAQNKVNLIPWDIQDDGVSIFEPSDEVAYEPEVSMIILHIYYMS